MITDEELKLGGMQALISKLGDVEAERSISLIMKSPFDYTEWQKDLWINRSIIEISKDAMKSRKT